MQVDKSLFSRPTCSSNSQNHKRLELLSPMTTGRKTIVRVMRLSGVLSARQQGQREAEDHQDRGQDDRIFDREHQRAPEARIVPDLE